VTLSLANHHASLPVAYRMYLPKECADDEKRCRRAVYPTTSVSIPSQKSLSNRCAGRVNPVCRAASY
jgi:hypothetical protein